jgi:hypothetical protein
VGYFKNYIDIIGFIFEGELKPIAAGTNGATGGMSGNGVQGANGCPAHIRCNGANGGVGGNGINGGIGGNGKRRCLHSPGEEQ